MTIKVTMDSTFHVGHVSRETTRRIQQAMIAGERRARRVYQRNVGRPYPPASLPGRFPHRRSGRLQRGVRVNVNRVGWHKIQLTLANVVRYARFLEFGTRRMAARPHLGPTLEMVWGHVRSRLNRIPGVRFTRGRRRA